MKVPPFVMERWQSTWENHVAINISESGVHPMSVDELVEDKEKLQQLLTEPLLYPQSNGIEELRDHIAALYPGATRDNVLVTTGCAEANFLVAWKLLTPGDEVVFQQPNYMQLAGWAEGLGAEVKPWLLREELGWAPDLDELRNLVTPKTKLICLCNPSNPTGAVLNGELLDGVCAVAEKVGAYVLADEVYRGAEFEGDMSLTAWGRYDRLFCNGGLSKAYGLPGLRIGWTVCSPDWEEELWTYHDYTTISTSWMSSKLAAIALEPKTHERIRQRTRSILHKNYPAVKKWIEGHKDIFTHRPPAAGAIAWIGFKDKNFDDAEFVKELKEKKDILAVSGDHLGMSPYLRIGFGSHPEELEQALAGMDELLAG